MRSLSTMNLERIEVIYKRYDRHGYCVEERIEEYVPKYKEKIGFKKK